VSALFREAIGKHVADHVYAHVSTLDVWPSALRELISRAGALTQLEASRQFNVVKVHVSGGQLSLLAYDDFDDTPFPTLARSWHVNLETDSVVYRDYAQSRNPPILHRKELLLAPGDPRVSQWATVTQTAESLGLFDDTSRIGFREQWHELIAAKGYTLCGSEFLPVANVPVSDDMATSANGPVQRHLTALSRSNLSAPVQALWRHGLITPERSVFDYGCGKGDDIRALIENGIQAAGWDPYFRPDGERYIADTVNLGFVVNVIDDLDERIQALRGAYALTRGVLAVAAMLAGQQPPDGCPHRDGFITSRNTFQKYFTQLQLRDFIEHVLDEVAIAAGPGVFFVFKDKMLEQRFLRQRYGERTPHDERRWTVPARAPQPARERVVRGPKLSRTETLAKAHRALLEKVWRAWVALGCPPQSAELAPALIDGLDGVSLPLSKALRLVATQFDQSELHAAQRQKIDDLVVFAALSESRKRQAYRALDPALQLDVRHHFGDYRSLLETAHAALRELTDLEKLNAACVTASAQGLGWLEDSHSLQVQTCIVPRLPALLRLYVGCATLLAGDIADFDLVKIHIRSGKLSLLRFANFATSPVPRLVQRVKVKLRQLDLDLFDYAGDEAGAPLLFWKSRFMNEECADYANQLRFEAQLQRCGFGPLIDNRPNASAFTAALTSERWQIDGHALVRSTDLPALDASCGRHFRYRDFIECGASQARTGLANLPRQADTYTALHDLAQAILDPVIEYFGMIELTYGFCSPELARAIPRRIAPNLDQHAAHELTRTGRPICARLGAACDFLVTDEDMEEVALWVAANTPFDRIYFYGRDRPLHVSYSTTPARQFVRMTANAAGVRVPRVDRTIPVFRAPESET